MFPNGFGDPFGFNSGPMIVDSSSEVPCFTYVLLLAFLTTDKVDAVVSTAGHRSQTFVALSCHRAAESVSWPAEFAQEASLIRARGETPVG